MKNAHFPALGRLGKKKKSTAKVRSVIKNSKLRMSSSSQDWVSFFNVVDDVRHTKSVESLHQLYLKSRPLKKRALLNATAKYLCSELNLSVPDWASCFIWLKTPWFVSGIENLKASALVESPIEFRANNIFVLRNFLTRV